MSPVALVSKLCSSLHPLGINLRNQFGVYWMDKFISFAFRRGWLKADIKTCSCTLFLSMKIWMGLGNFGQQNVINFAFFEHLETTMTCSGRVSPYPSLLFGGSRPTKIVIKTCSSTMYLGMKISTGSVTLVINMWSIYILRAFRTHFGTFRTCKLMPFTFTRRRWKPVWKS